MKKNEIYEVEIIDISADGNGIGKVDGYTLFIKDGLIGDLVKVRVTKTKKNYGYARLEQILKPSPSRVEAKCPHARPCGGCQLQEMDYRSQLQFKQKKVMNNLVRLGGFEANLVAGLMEPITGMDNPFNYRYKAQVPFGTDKEGRQIAGFFAGRTHSIIACTDCALGVKENKEIIEIILEYMNTYGVAAYDESSGNGVIRHALLRKGYATGQLMVCLVVNIQCDGEQGTLPVSDLSDAYVELPHLDKLVGKLMAIEGMTSVSLSFNTRHDNVIMGEKILTIAGQDRIEDRLSNLTFAISPLSFYQVNPWMTERMYGKALEYAGLTGNEVVWDLYCGIGTISLFLAKAAGEVHGVEIVEPAIEDARENARRNNVENALFYVGAAEDVAPSLPRPDVIVVDPPRKGCDEKLLHTILSHEPERVVYVSCDSATLARDLKVLCAGGYKLEKVAAFDNFAQTVHVETVVLITRKEK